MVVSSDDAWSGPRPNSAIDTIILRDDCPKPRHPPKRAPARYAIYNVQFAADTKSGAVGGVTVDNIGSDMGRMEPMSAALEAAYGRRPAEHLADGGFAKLGDITALAQAGVTPFVPVPAPKDKTRDRFAPRPDDPPDVAAWRQRMATEEAKEIYKERAATAECVNAQARNRGLTRFLVRGMDKVRAVALWHALAHNMACGWRLLPA
jgi:hypothetical protein